jgi:hypothetical protein
MTVDGLVRFRRLARKLVREHVAEQKEPPPLSLWVSHGERPQRAAYVPVGAAESAGGVAVNVRECVKLAGSSYAALGRALADAAPGSAGPILTTTFGLVVASVARVEFWAVEIRAGGVGAWWQCTGADARWGLDVAALLQASLRDVAAARELEESRAVEDDVQARIDAAFAARQEHQPEGER